MALLLGICFLGLSSAESPPIISITHPSGSPVNHPGVGLYVTCEVENGEDGGQLGLYLDGEHGGDFPVAQTGNYNFTLPPLSNGCHFLELLLSSSGVNLAFASITFSVGPLPPPISDLVTDKLISDALFGATNLDDYSASYWEYQRPIGEIGGKLNLWKFRDFIPPDARCVDFGAGGGFLLQNMQDCKEKVGVEVNPYAIQHADEKFGLKLVNNSRYLTPNWADVIFSNHALEHVLCPWCELVRLKTKLRKGGSVVFVVPSASGKFDFWKGRNSNNHISDFSPNVLGHLFEAAGFAVKKVEHLWHQWPGGLHAIEMYETLGEDQFLLAGRSEIERDPNPANEVQIRILATNT
mmetsp:Transcript_32285/g.82232  ORF Transcript_32285/g.82232 Transcript_32285/m.82232 type:complete len:352 (+) Transcript_32285:404-1459(+)